MKIKVIQTELHIHELTARMPFRYGIATMTHLPHLIIGAQVEIDGRVHYGQAAENLAPKWFTKNPDTSPQQDVQQMLDVIRSACRTAAEIGEVPSVFALWRELYAAQERESSKTGEPPLLWGLGVSLVERAVIDAFCRASNITFGDALRQNRFGIELRMIYPELGDAVPSDLLPANSLDRMIVRHTIGLGDPLTDAEIPDAQRLDDGLPQSLQACIAAYGLTHFKIKLGGDASQDLERLTRIAQLLDGTYRTYAFTLDGNENYRAIEPFKQFWHRAAQAPALRQFMSRLIFVEQPLHRDVALGADAQRELTGWIDRPAMIIDESGGSVQNVTEALDCGYVGTSHKNCKGVIKGIAAACLVEHRNRSNAGHASLIISAEDLSNTGPVALCQDFAVAAALGISHIERNGHHYFRGLDAWPADVQEQVLRSHEDLFRRDCLKFARLQIISGEVEIASVNRCYFGTNIQPDINRLRHIG